MSNVVWIKGAMHFAVTTPQISFTGAQEEMCLSIHFCFGSGMFLGCSAWVRMQLSVMSADMEQSLAPGTQTSGPWQD